MHAPTFATRWLLPRLGTFQQAHPGITLHLSARTRPFLFDESGLDAAIHAGEGGWPGTDARLLMPERLVAVAAPWCLGSRKRLGAADIAKLPLLQSSTRPYAWREWFASLGLSVERDLAGPRMELFSMLTEAAAQGLGAALVPHFLVEDELAGGRLVVLNEHEFISKLAYYLIVPEHKVEDPVLALFGNWITTEAARYSAA